MLNYDTMAKEIIKLFETSNQVDSDLIYHYFVKYKYNSKMEDNQKKYLYESILKITNKKRIKIIAMNIKQSKTNTIVVYFDIES